MGLILAVVVAVLICQVLYKLVWSSLHFSRIHTLKFRWPKTTNSTCKNINSKSKNILRHPKPFWEFKRQPRKNIGFLMKFTEI